MKPRLALMPILAALAGCAAAPPAAPPAAKAAGPALALYRNAEAGPPPDRTRTGRYSYVGNGPAPAQVDPLLAVIEVTLPASLATVGDASGYLLERAGYCLMEPDTPQARHLLGLPLPQVHRRLGPMTVREALLALGGRAFELAVDEAYREAGYRPAALATAGGGP